MAHLAVSHLHTPTLLGAIFAGVFLNIARTNQGGVIFRLPDQRPVNFRLAVFAKEVVI